MGSTGKIVVIGSCSVDFTTYAPRLPSPGETLIGTKFTTSYGGKGANQCVAAAKLGGSVSMVGRLGDDIWGKQYKEHLRSIGVDTTSVYITPDTTTGIAQISVGLSGENQIVIVPGANQMLSLADVESSKGVIESADIIIAQLETPFETTLEAFKLNNGIKLLNAAPAIKNINKIFPHCSILCVNEPEASMLSDVHVKDLESAKEALSKLLHMGCETVIITLGENGAIYATKGQSQPIHVLCDKLVPVDTTGAGDAFVGALATFLLKYKSQPLHQIIGAACHVATLSVTREGTQSSYPTDFEGITKEYKYNAL